MNRDIDGLFARDGLIHPAYTPRQAVITGRRGQLNEDSYKDAAVCLTCTADVCEGDSKCFRRRMSWLSAAHEDVTALPAGTLLDNLIYADEICESDGWMIDLPDEF